MRVDWFHRVHRGLWITAAILVILLLSALSPGTASLSFAPIPSHSTLRVDDGPPAPPPPTGPAYLYITITPVIMSNGAFGALQVFCEEASPVGPTTTTCCYANPINATWWKSQNIWGVGTSLLDVQLPCFAPGMVGTCTPNCADEFGSGTPYVQTNDTIHQNYYTHTRWPTVGIFEKSHSYNGFGTIVANATATESSNNQTLYWVLNLTTQAGTGVYLGGTYSVDDPLSYMGAGFPTAEMSTYDPNYNENLSQGYGTQFGSYAPEGNASTLADGNYTYCVACGTTTFGLTSSFTPTSGFAWSNRVPTQSSYFTYASTWGENHGSPRTKASVSYMDLPVFGEDPTYGWFSLGAVCPVVHGNTNWVYFAILTNYFYYYEVPGVGEEVGWGEIPVWITMPTAWSLT